MQIIISHVNTDFDALASMVAAKKLYPDAKLVIPDKQEDRVSRFLNIYRDMFEFVRDIHVDWAQVNRLILVDVASLRRVGRISAEFDEDNTHIIVYDHHPVHPNNVTHDEGIIEEVGAAVTLLVEEIRERQLPMTEFEATLFGLGLYTDTGNFIYKNTTKRDLEVASYLMDCGMNLELVQRFSEQTLAVEQQDLLDQLLVGSKTYLIDGLEIIVSDCQLNSFQGGLALVTNTLLAIKGGDAALSVVKMKNHIHVVGRASSDRVTLLPLLKSLGGGGHSHAGSAMVKNGDFDVVLENVVENLDTMLKPALTAAEIMSQPVKTLTPETTIEEAGSLMYRYGHSGYPIVENNRLVGLITRRDLDKGNHHGLGHAPVKAYMTTAVKTVTPETTLEELQKLIIEHNIGRLPVVKDDEIIGIVTRTNIIEILHDELSVPGTKDDSDAVDNNYKQQMEEQLPSDVFTLLEQMGATATKMDLSVYLIGGMVRDILLKRSNDDIDIVVEGDGISFAHHLKESYGGEMLIHDSFGTATWTHPVGFMIDITSSRLEYYERPASLPDVELSTLEEDLQRRDFTINAMAFRLNHAMFGELIDPFGGQADLDNRTIRILHNISFVEDPTRIFRAVRFEERFQFLMDEQTRNLALNSIDKVKKLSTSRIVAEMKRLFQEGNPPSVMRRLFDLNFWQQLAIHDNKKELTCQSVEMFLSTISDITKVEKPSWFNFFLIPFFLDDKIADAEKFALTKKEISLFKEIISLQAIQEIASAKKVGDLHRYLKDYSSEAIVFIVSTGTVKNGKLLAQYLKKRGSLPSYFTGRDLMKKGLKPGPFFSDLFLRLEIEQLNKTITSKEEAEDWLTKVIENEFV